MSCLLGGKLHWFELFAFAKVEVGFVVGFGFFFFFFHPNEVLQLKAEAIKHKWVSYVSVFFFFFPPPLRFLVKVAEGFSMVVVRGGLSQ